MTLRHNSVGHLKQPGSVIGALQEQIICRTSTRRGDDGIAHNRAGAPRSPTDLHCTYPYASTDRMRNMVGQDFTSLVPVECPRPRKAQNRLAETPVDQCFFSVQLKWTTTLSRWCQAFVSRWGPSGKAVVTRCRAAKTSENGHSKANVT